MENLLFSPGPVPGDYHFKIDFSHRAQFFERLHRECVEGLQYLLPDRDIYFVQGSASAAIEAVLGFICTPGMSLKVLGEGVFSGRITRAATSLGIEMGNASWEVVAGVQFETSVSQLNDWSETYSPKYYKPFSISDSVSAFPYYKPPNADVLILSSAKQLRGLPVLGIIAARKNLFKMLHEQVVRRQTKEYLDIPSILMYAERDQTPHTALIPQFISLRDSLNDALWKPGVGSIDANSTILVHGRAEKIIGQHIAPVITMKCQNVNGLRVFLLDRKIEAYFNKSYMKGQVQFSTFNYDKPEPYERLNDALKAAEKEGLL